MKGQFSSKVNCLFGIFFKHSSKLKPFKGYMTFILTIGHRKISTKSKNKKRGNNDSRYSGSKTNNSTEISNGTVISISYCTHGDNYKPKTVFKDHEIRLVVSLAEGNHLTKSNYKAHIKKD